MRAAGFLFLALLFGSPTGAQENVLILVADDLGVDMVAAYGEHPGAPDTPNLDRLAQDGLLFRNAWAQPFCSPTRAELMTGRYAFRTGVGQNVSSSTQPLLPGELTLPEMLALDPTLGYSTAAFGKWHLGNATVGGVLAPNLAGFGHYAGHLGNLTGGQTYTNWNATVDGVTTPVSTYATTWTVDRALGWIGQTPEPWLAYVAFHAPHNPWHAPPFALHGKPLPKIDPRDLPRPFYLAAVEALDTEIGRLLDGLGPLEARTTVIFLGDNGSPNKVTTPPFVPWHAKGTPYEGGVNVPLLVRGPSVQQPGREVTALVHAVDVFATVADLAGVDLATLQPGLVYDSVSLVPYFQSPGQPPLRSDVYSEFFQPSGTGPWSRHDQIARDDRWKLVRRLTPGSLREQLYDLQADPFESQNLLDGPITPQITAAYQSLLSVIRDLLP